MISQIEEINKKVYKLANTDDLYYRVLYINKLTDRVYVIDIKCNSKKIGKYSELSYEKFLEGIEAQRYILLDRDIFLPLVSEEKLTKSAKEIRDKAWNQIKSLVKNQPDIFISNIRFQLIKEESEKDGGASIPSYFKWLKSYDAYGQVPNALLPNFQNCGAPGEEKKNCELSTSLKKIIRQGYKKYFIGKSTIRSAYKNTLRTMYNSAIHGEKKFTIDQFYYWGSREWTYSEALKRKIGKRKYKSTRRLLRGRTSDMASFVGELYQIDWTLTDIQCVSSLNRNDYIGRPTLYLVVDTISRAITGLLLTFENPSYITLCNAFYNAGRNKVEFAKECGFVITDDDWITNIIPNRLIGDRGELLSTKADSIANSLHVTVENTAAYSPELKGIIELLIGRVTERVKQLFDGKGRVDKDFGERLSNDSRKEATVTLKELYEITIKCIIEYNNHHWIDDYPLTTEMVRDRVKKIPMEIWKWAHENGHSTGKTFDKETLWLSLLEGKMVTPSRKGIYLNKQYFVPVDNEDFKLFENLICAPIIEQIKVSYDPRIYNEIYWLHENRFILLRTRGKEDAKYSNEWEVIGTNQIYKELSNEYKAKEIDVEIEGDKEFMKTIGEGKKSASANLKNAKLGRKAEKALGRKAVPRVNIAQEKAITEPTTQESKYSKPDYTNELDQLNL